MSIFNLPEELLCNILNYLPLKDLINARLINNYFQAFIKNNPWNNHLINLYCGEEKILEYLLNNYKFKNFRLESLNITDELVLKLTKTWFVRFAYCIMTMKNFDILNQFHCYTTKKCISLLNDNMMDIIIDKYKTLDIIVMLKQMNKTNNEINFIHKQINGVYIYADDIGFNRIISIVPKRKICNKINCEKKYCKYILNEINKYNEIDKYKTFHKNILPFLNETVVNIHEKHSTGYAYYGTIVAQRKRYEKLYVSEFVVNDELNNNELNNNELNDDNYIEERIVKPKCFMQEMIHLLFNNDQHSKRDNNKF
jgi:hypothetical protein